MRFLFRFLLLVFFWVFSFFATSQVYPVQTNVVEIFSPRDWNPVVTGVTLLAIHNQNIQAEKETASTSELHMYQSWDNFYTAVNIVEGAVGITQFALNLPRIIVASKGILTKLKDIPNNIGTLWSNVKAYFKGVSNAGGGVKDIVSKRIIKTISKWDNKLGKLVEYPKYNNVALGKSSGGTLKQFGDDVGANVWTSETDNIFTSMYDLPSSWTFERSITSVFNETIGTNGGKILFDISGVNLQKGITGGMVHNEALVMQGFVTEFELQILLRNRNWYDNVIFHEGGKVLSSQEIATKSLNFIGQ